MIQDTNGSGKGNQPRPSSVSQNIWELGYRLAYGDLPEPQREFLRRKLKRLRSEMRARNANS